MTKAWTRKQKTFTTFSQSYQFIHVLSSEISIKMPAANFYNIYRTKRKKKTPKLKPKELKNLYQPLIKGDAKTITYFAKGRWSWIKYRWNMLILLLLPWCLEHF